MTSFDPPSFDSETHSSVTPEPTTPLGAPTSAALPTMGDLDRLVAALDQVDRTLVELDGSAGLAEV